MTERFLPLFPLQLVAFPGEEVHLHIFEPRYRQLIAECRDEGKTFGIPPHIGNGVAEFGTEMALESIVRTYDSGEMDIVVRGVNVFQLKSFIKVTPGKLYAGGSVLITENDPSVAPETREALAQLYRKLHLLLNTGHTRSDFDSPNLSFQIGHETGLSFTQRIQLLAIASEEERQQFIIDHLRHVLPVLDATEHSKQRVRANGKFHKYPTIEL